jgi:hypothetical protein
VGGRVCVCCPPSAAFATLLGLFHTQRLCRNQHGFKIHLAASCWL